MVADLGYEHIQLTPHRDLIPFFRHPKADAALVRAFKNSCDDAGVGIASCYTQQDCLRRAQVARETAGDMARYQLATMQNYIAKHHAG